MTTRDFDWLVGLLEGEGCFMHSSPGAPPRIAIHMKDEDVMQRVGRLFERKVIWLHPPSHRAKGWSPLWRCTLSGSPALDMMERLLPGMGERRSAKIVEILTANGRM